MRIEVGGTVVQSTVNVHVPNNFEVESLVLNHVLKESRGPAMVGQRVGLDADVGDAADLRAGDSEHIVVDTSCRIGLGIVASADGLGTSAGDLS